MPESGVNLCPVFATLAKTMGEAHPSHVATNPVVPYYNYSMNAFLGNGPGGSTSPAGIANGKASAITRSKAEVFFFAEENMWARPGNATCSMITPCAAIIATGSARSTAARRMTGTVARSTSCSWTATLGALKSALQEVDGQMDKSEAEYGLFEKYSYPFKKYP